LYINGPDGESHCGDPAGLPGDDGAHGCGRLNRSADV